MSTLSGHIEYPIPSRKRIPLLRDRSIEYSTSARQKVRLLDQMKLALRSRHYSRRTEQTYCLWVRRFVQFHSLRHPAEMGEPEINAFLTHLAVKEKVSASTQNQALSALLFLYRHVIGREVGDLGDVIRARRPQRLPVVMAREEVKAVLGCLEGDKWLMGESHVWGRSASNGTP
jgi:hypothetical protein